MLIEIKNHYKKSIRVVMVKGMGDDVVERVVSSLVKLIATHIYVISYKKYTHTNVIGKVVYEMAKEDVNFTLDVPSKKYI